MKFNIRNLQKISEDFLALHQTAYGLRCARIPLFKNNELWVKLTDIQLSKK